uniref:Uncharacterized protein n=1 Tax=Caenorhabditis japonica TaxID=281687 RepID=A0A8R1I848_CAEJA
MFPKVSRTRNAVLFLQYFITTFKHMFQNSRPAADEHFDYYDEQVKGYECYIGEMGYGTTTHQDFKLLSITNCSAHLKLYFERYVASHSDPQIEVIYAVMTRDGMNMHVEFHVTTMTWFGFSDHFHIIINAYNVSLINI